MNIRFTKLDELAQRLARLTCEDVETAQRLSGVAPPATADRNAAITSFFDQVSRMRVLDPRTVNEIVDDGRGLPS
jgi:antitoxin VapB